MEALNVIKGKEVEITCSFVMCIGFQYLMFLLNSSALSDRPENSKTSVLKVQFLINAVSNFQGTFQKLVIQLHLHILLQSIFVYYCKGMLRSQLVIAI